mmetsp:Transcript_18254/g.16143  ORF Transcript_18254/g.16143 Transcript_18254/m.16143 type:complete len:133 (+) Transcript_18254:420-818(+)
MKIGFKTCLRVRLGWLIKILKFQLNKAIDFLSELKINQIATDRANNTTKMISFFTPRHKTSPIGSLIKSSSPQTINKDKIRMMSIRRRQRILTPDGIMTERVNRQISQFCSDTQEVPIIRSSTALSKEDSPR